MSQEQNFGLSEKAKANLLAKMRGQAAPKIKHERSLEEQISPDLLRFDTLPCYTQLKVQQAVAAKLGFPDPYYACHSGLSQAHATILGKTYLNFSCYDYLGLNGDPRLLEAVSNAAKTYGISASASRLTAGERPPHHALEAGLAEIYGTEDCLVFVSGHATNVSTIECLFGPQDVIFYDALSHNSLILGAQAAGSARFCYPSNDTKALRNLLIEHRKQFKRALIVTEGLFGMDGCVCDLPELLALKQEFGCFLMVDEAHSLGVLGEHGFGVSEYFKIKPSQVDIWMGTLSKTFCGCGGFIAGSHVLIEILKYFAPGFVYSVGLPPLLAAASCKALEIMQEEPWRVAKLQANSRYMLEEAHKLGLDTGKAQGSAVIPVHVGDSLSCVILAHMLREAQILVLPIIYPGVEEGKARLRFFVSATHTEEQISLALNKTQQLLPKARARAADFSG
ncbi:MAG: aminotransferase class I/II-fold pyridoxal phosphate-dependent enzyme [Desulfovibrionaceae bacterium]|nr:aminotransferase class I/II-fold pyridoxal phosphate-dependent enzyme [Desulfovibrionaceae bacterium]